MSKRDNSLPAIEGGKPVRKKFLIFGSPLIGKDEIKEVVHSLKTGWIGTGPKVAKFENLIKEYTGTKYAMAVNSATAGLHLSLVVLGIGKADEVITTPMTFCASANVIEHVGAKPVFVDVDLKTMNIDPSKIEKKITKKTKAILPVHMAGRPAEMSKILKVAQKYKLKIIEDAAHAIGASYKGKRVGNIGDLTSFSFYATKNLVTGEGGMVTTNSKKYADLIKIYALHGMSQDAWKRYSDEGFKHYQVEVPGYKYNMMDIQAALGIHQFYRFESMQKRRKEIWEMYNKAFKDLPVMIPAEIEPGTEHAFHLYTILVDIDKLKASRDDVQNALHAENIGIGVHFTSLHLHNFYRNKYGYLRGDFPNTEFISDRTISLPLSAKLTNKDVSDVITAVRKVINYYLFKSPKRVKKKLPKAATDVR